MLRPMFGTHDLIDEAEVGPGRAIRFRRRRDTFPEVVERLRHARCFDGGRGRDGLIKSLAGDEPAGEAAGSAQTTGRSEVFESSAAGERVEKSLGQAVEHQ